MARKKPLRRRHPALLIGVTGGIASGKSAVTGLFAALGAPVIDTDIIAREIVRPGSPVLDAIRSRFGAAVLLASGELDRRELRRQVFADARARQDLEALTHPAILAQTQAQSASAGGDYQLIVVPLLAEKQLQDRYDRVLVVDCEPGLQLQRLMVRDGATKSEATAILAAQATREQRLALADDVIVNVGDLRQLAAAVEALHWQYREQAGNRPAPL